MSSKIYSAVFLPSPQQLSFLRCLPYIALQLPVILRDTAGRRGVILLETRSERCITLSPCVPVREYRGSAHWARGLTFTVKNLLSSFLPPLLSNYRFFGVSPMLLCNSLSSYPANFLLNLKMRDISSGFDISLLVKIPLFLQANFFYFQNM